MRSQTIIVSCLISVALVATASASWVPLTGDPVSLSSLQGEPLLFGDKELSDVNFFGYAEGGAITPNTDSVYVQGGYDDITLDYGLKFYLSWMAGPNQIVNVNLEFKVSIQDGFDDYYIKDVGLDITGAHANGTGVVGLGELVQDEFGNDLVHLSCSAWQGSPVEYLTDYKEFDPVKAIWINSKDISITGGANGSAHISQFYQYYSQVQVPEPATITLFGITGILILTRKNKEERNICEGDKRNHN